MLIVEKKISELVPSPRNARLHSPEQLAQIAGSITRFGFRVPVLIDGDNGIIAGHGRVMAALSLCMETVPCVDGSDMSETDRRAYALADNRIALNATWDNEMLGLEVRDLAELEVDVSDLGFDQAEIDEMLGGYPAEDADEAPDDKYKEQYGVIVTCRDERHQETVFNRLAEQGFDCKVVAT